jgi:hypothetical protein
MTHWKWLWIVVCCSALAGCSSKPGGGVGGELAAAPRALFDLNDLLHSVAGMDGRPAGQLSDLDKRRSLFPQGYNAVKNGDIIVLWGTTPKGEGAIAKGGEQLVAYEKAVPTDGGYVLYSGGTIKKMTAAEFAAAPKAGKPSP